MIKLFFLIHELLEDSDIRLDTEPEFGIFYVENLV